MGGVTLFAAKPPFKKLFDYPVLLPFQTGSRLKHVVTCLDCL